MLGWDEWDLSRIYCNDLGTWTIGKTILEIIEPVLWIKSQYE